MCPGSCHDDDNGAWALGHCTLISMDQLIHTAHSVRLWLGVHRDTLVTGSLHHCALRGTLASGGTMGRADAEKSGGTADTMEGDGKTREERRGKTGRGASGQHTWAPPRLALGREDLCLVSLTRVEIQGGGGDPLGRNRVHEEQSNPCSSLLVWCSSFHGPPLIRPPFLWT